ncbi:hypothetical protein SAMN04487895_102420 [Paenibacillus sophorae]|uniref:Uncharacterized protein n=1 Tax=Paenibacillus sophorae TaxID=1333845 RepID=A0A1H8J0Z9_9BACL|nr:hypothetical protein [Paenibacillus sophorae]QWU16164.1 hypothetical protein KP014_02495 [Paenibacillus sophorae]SEN74309.1 hypothetical protein SAMN04487895_102420 [Paenibacillus sophorae]
MYTPKSFESELLIQFKDEDIFLNALEDGGPEDLKIDLSYEELVVNLYVDSEDYILKKNNFSLALRPLPDKKVGSILKYNISEFKEHVIRAEIAELMNTGCKYSKVISDTLQSKLNCCTDNLIPTLISKQKRTHKKSNRLSPTLYFSFDKVTFNNLRNGSEITLFLMEVETTGNNIGNIYSTEMFTALEYYKKKYDAIKVFPSSKYIIGLEQTLRK